MRPDSYHSWNHTDDEIRPVEEGAEEGCIHIAGEAGDGNDGHGHRNQRKDEVNHENAFDEPDAAAHEPVIFAQGGKPFRAAEHIKNDTQRDPHDGEDDDKAQQIQNDIGDGHIEIIIHRGITLWLKHPGGHIAFKPGGDMRGQIGGIHDIGELRPGERADGKRGALQVCDLLRAIGIIDDGIKKTCIA